MKKILTSLLCSMICLPCFSQWNSNTAVNLEISSLQAADLHALSTTDGKTWIAFYSKDGTGNYDMRAQLLDVDGNKLLGPDGVLVDSFTSGSAVYVFNICLDEEDNLIIAAQDMRGGGGLQAVAYKIDQSGASQWNGAAGVLLGDGLAPSALTLASGEVLFAWSRSNVIDMQKVDSAGNTVWSMPKSFTSPVGSPSRGQLAAMTDSGFVMVYQQGAFGINSTLYAQRFDADGEEVWTAPVQLSNEATSLARYYSLKQDGDTTYFGYYTSTLSNHFNSWLQRINPAGSLPYGINGAAFSDYATGGEPDEQTTHIALDPASPYVWAVSSFSNSLQSEYGIYVQKFNKADGTRLLNVNGKEVYPIGTDRYAQQGGLTLHNDGPVFMFCSDNDYVIKGTVLDSMGDFVLPTQDLVLSSTTITQPTALYKGRFAFTDNVNGQSVAIWTENRNGAFMAYAQNMDLSIYDTSVVVTTENGMPATISDPNGVLQLAAVVMPATAGQDVTWSITPGSGAATITASGLVTASEDGTVWAKAVSVAAPSYADSIEITISNQTNGIDEIAKQIGIHIFPNPVKDILTIELQHAHPDLSVRLVDIYGRVLQTTQIPADQSLLTLTTMNLSGLSAGVYLLQIDGEQLHLSRKVLKR